MKLAHYFTLTASLLLSLAACETPQPTVEPTRPVESTSPDQSGTVTNVGQPQGAVVSQSVGPAGGSLRTADGSVQLTIPTGSLTQTTTISVQPISNENSTGLGTAYRFLPEGLRFNKPATLTFQYDVKNLSSENAGNLGVAYQRADGVWYDVAGSSVNTARHEISVPMEHFSDWTPYELAQLNFARVGSVQGNGTEYVDLGKSINLYAALNTWDDNYPKSATEKPLRAKRGLGTNWQLFGEGKLEKHSEGATYTAPAKTPKQNPVQVTTDLEFEGRSFRLTLFCRIYVGQGTYFNLIVDNAPRDGDSFSCSIIDKRIIFGCTVGAHTLAMIVNRSELAEGLFEYTKCGEDVPNSVEAAFASGPDGFIPYYEADCDAQCHRSSGGVRIDKIEVINGTTYVTGSMSGTFYRRSGVCNYNFKLEKTVLSGSFRLQLIKTA